MEIVSHYNCILVNIKAGTLFRTTFKLRVELATLVHEDVYLTRSNGQKKIINGHYEGRTRDLGVTLMSY